MAMSMGAHIVVYIHHLLLFLSELLLHPMRLTMKAAAPDDVMGEAIKTVKARRDDNEEQMMTAWMVMQLTLTVAHRDAQRSRLGRLPAPETPESLQGYTSRRR